MIREYLIQNGEQRILTESETNECLTEPTRKRMINCLCDFMISQFGEYPNKDAKINVALATVKLFPSLKFKDGLNDDGIVRNFNCAIFFFIYNYDIFVGFVVRFKSKHRMDSACSEKSKKKKESNICDR